MGRKIKWNISFFIVYTVYLTYLLIAKVTCRQYLYNWSKKCSTWPHFSAMTVANHFRDHHWATIYKKYACLFHFLCATLHALRIIQAVLQNVNNNKLYNLISTAKNRLKHLTENIPQLPFSFPLLPLPSDLLYMFSLLERRALVAWGDLPQFSYLAIFCHLPPLHSLM